MNRRFVLALGELAQQGLAKVEVRKLEAARDGLLVFSHGKLVIPLARGDDPEVTVGFGGLRASFVVVQEFFVVGLGKAQVSDAQKTLPVVQQNLGRFRGQGRGSGQQQSHVAGATKRESKTTVHKRLRNIIAAQCY